MKQEELRRVLYNDCESAEPYQDGLFEGGYCPRCGCGVGKRTTKAIEIRQPGNKDLWIPDRYDSQILIVSEKFMNLLQESSDGRIRFQEVKFVKPVRKKAYEILEDGAIEAVAMKSSFEPKMAIRCPVCGRRKLSNRSADGRSGCLAIRRCELPSGDCFLVGAGRFGVSIGVKTAWWKNIVKTLKGVPTGPLLIADDDDVMSNPPFLDYEPG
jgi:hypothetical protein